MSQKLKNATHSNHGNKYKTAIYLLVMVLGVYLMAIFKKYGG